jgi:hypothetical protein
MTQLLALQLRDENAVRVWARTLVDLALTVPSLRLEAVMSRRSAVAHTAVLYGGAAAACLVGTAVSGTAYGVALAGLLLAVVFGGLAVLAWRRARVSGASGDAYAYWWRYLAAGVAGVAGCVLVANVAGDDLPGNTWYVWIGVLLASWSSAPWDWSWASRGPLPLGGRRGPSGQSATTPGGCDGNSS